MKLNFTISELIYSQRAQEENIDNTPNAEALDNMLELIVNCLQPIRDNIKKPMIITSGYRSNKLNKLVGGTEKSQHLKGQAVDFKISGMKPAEIIEIIKKMGVQFDQLINEYDSWVHISFNKGKNRNQVLKICS